MKKIMLCFGILLFVLAVLAGCGGDAAPSAAQTEKLKVVATIFPPYDFVHEIAGDQVELTMLLPPGAESHSYEPTPQDIILIQDCDVFIHGGGESDTWIEDILSSMDPGERQVLSMLDMVEAKEEEIVDGMEEEEEQDHDHAETEPELDEHVWTSPKNAMRIVQSISDTLCELDAENADAYRQDTTAYLGELEELNAAFEEAVAAGVRKTLIFGDRFPFRYLADAYGLEYYAAFPGCSTQTEPSAETVAFLIDKVKEEHIPVVFHIELSNEKMADTICGETGAEKSLLHSCHNISKEERDAGVSYLSLMTQNAAAIEEALQ